jgi:hypothetical protein
MNVPQAKRALRIVNAVNVGNYESVKRFSYLLLFNRRNCVQVSELCLICKTYLWKCRVAFCTRPAITML